MGWFQVGSRFLEGITKRHFVWALEGRSKEASYGNGMEYH
jgi:hypothetical protein